MKNFMSIRKLYEDLEPEQGMQAQAPLNMAPPAPVQPMNQMGMEQPMEPIEPSAPHNEMPHSDQKALPDFDPMNLTISQFMERCDKINPLVCMGLKTFIETNKDALANEVNGGEKFDLEKEADLDFPPKDGPQQPANPEFSLDQPASDLEFPQAETVEI
jgi:hypothetical protein